MVVTVLPYCFGIEKNTVSSSSDHGRHFWPLAAQDSCAIMSKDNTSEILMSFFPVGEM